MASKATPLLSVIIPVFNGERFLAEAIASAQTTDTPLEIIVVDDGSTDGTAGLAANREDIIYIREENAGPAAARNRGLELAKGDLIGFLDADDVWATGHPGEGVQYLLQRPETDVVIGQVQCMMSSEATAEAFAPSGEPFHSYQLGAAIVRRALVDRIGGFDITMRYGEDVDWFLKVRESGAAISTLPALALYYRLHSGNQPTIYRTSREGLLNAFHHSLQRRRGESDSEHSVDKRPLVTAVIPVFNGESFIAQAIASVVAQDYRPIEIVVVDDGSTDRTREIVKKIPEVTLLEEPHRGAGAARNAGVRASKGEFIAFLDADDLWSRGKLSRQMDVFKDGDSLEAVFGHAVQFSEPGGHEIARPLPSASPATMLIRRTAFERIGWFPEDETALEGVEWLLRAKEQSLRSQMLPDVLYRRRIHGRNRSVVSRDLNGYVRAIKASLDRRRSRARPSSDVEPN